MAIKTKDVITTLQRNTLMRHYQPEAVFTSLREPLNAIDEMVEAVKAVKADPHLSAEGRTAKCAALLAGATERVTTWRTKRLAGLDADLTAQRAALTPSGKAPDPRRVDHLLAVLRTFTPLEVSVVYGSASEDERVVMEAAAALVGRTLVKTSEGGIVWAPLIEPDVIAEAVMARAAAAHPEAVDRMRELTEVRAMTATVAGNALADLRAVANEI